MASELGDALFLTMMIRHEHALADLYQVMAEKLPKTKTFWQHIAAEEIRHAELLQNLAEEVKLGLSALAPGRLGCGAVKTSLDFIEPKTRSWANWGVTAERAFDVALYLEGSVLEHQVLMPVDGDSCFAVSVLNAVQRHTREHVMRLREAAEKYKQSWFRRLFSRN